MIAPAPIQLHPTNIPGGNHAAFGKTAANTGGKTQFASLLATLTGALPQTTVPPSSGYLLNWRGRLASKPGALTSAPAASHPGSSGKLLVDKSGRRLTVLLDSAADLDLDLVKEIAAALNKNPGIKEIVVKMAAGKKVQASASKANRATRLSKVSITDELETTPKPVSGKARTSPPESGTPAAGKKGQASASKANQAIRPSKVSIADELETTPKSVSGKARTSPPESEMPAISKKSRASASKANQATRPSKVSIADELETTPKPVSGKAPTSASKSGTTGKQPASGQPTGGFDAKTWLRQQLAEKGIQTDNIRIELRQGEPLKRTGAQAEVKLELSNRQASGIPPSPETTPAPKTIGLHETDGASQPEKVGLAGKMSRAETGKPHHAHGPLRSAAANETQPSELAESQSEQKQDKQQDGRRGHGKSPAQAPRQTRPVAARAQEKVADDHGFKEATRAATAEKIGNHLPPTQAGKNAAATATPSSQMTQALRKIASMAEQQLTASGKKLEVQIDIKDVGKVLVDAVRSADKIQLQIQVESHEVRRLLQSQLRPLIEHLTRDGLEVGKVNVTVRDDRESYQPHGDFAQARHDQRQRFEEGRGRYRQSVIAPEERTESRPTRPALARANGSMEIWA